jgi:hypothetical protein
MKRSIAYIKLFWRKLNLSRLKSRIKTKFKSRTFRRFLLASGVLIVILVSYRSPALAYEAYQKVKVHKKRTWGEWIKQKFQSRSAWKAACLVASVTLAGGAVFTIYKLYQENLVLSESLSTSATLSAERLQSLINSSNLLSKSTDFLKVAVDRRDKCLIAYDDMANSLLLSDKTLKWYTYKNKFLINSLSIVNTSLEWYIDENKFLTNSLGVVSTSLDKCLISLEILNKSVDFVPNKQLVKSILY